MYPADSDFLKIVIPSALIGIGVMAAIWLPGEFTWTRLISGGITGIVVMPSVSFVIGRWLTRTR